MNIKSGNAFLLCYNSFRSENDDFRRNHYLSSLLHIQTKCDMLTKKLTKDQCLFIKQNVRSNACEDILIICIFLQDPSFVSKYLMKDAVKHCNSLYTLNTGDTSSNRVVKTNESIMKLAEKITAKVTEENADSVIRNSIKIAQSYFTHQLITVNKNDFNHS
jgi:hypothetical protein